MKKLLDEIAEIMGDAFAKAGYDRTLGRVGVSNRPDLCEYQCNGAMAGAKQYHKAPLAIAGDVAAVLAGETAAGTAAGGEFSVFANVQAVAPGFLNFDLSPAFLQSYVQKMADSDKYGLTLPEAPEKIIVDYGGPNVAKPLHVGHLRAAIIGESIKRIKRYFGNDVTGDIHMGDWGLQMGLIITELKERQPELVYFDDAYAGEYPKEAPFTISELEEIYPTASARSKEDEAYKARAMEATKKLQDGVRGYRALWQHIIDVSVADLKKNYDRLRVEFDLWNGESTVHGLIPGMVAYMKDGGYAYMSDGALVVDVKEETDTKEVPPCMILKSDGAALYNTTDLATIMDRMKTFSPDRIIYVVDKRQGLYFEQVFRCARKTKLVRPETKLDFVGFGTMNGKDGKPFKTRAGGVMRLESLILEIEEEMERKLSDNQRDEKEGLAEEERKKIASVVALSAIKYGDLSNQATKDYCFDVEKFTSFEGDTGPYILYTIARIKSILRKYDEETQGSTDGRDGSALRLGVPRNASEKALLRSVVRFHDALEAADKELAPHRICAFIYELANSFNTFYHETKILKEPDKKRRAELIALLMLCEGILETCIDLLGFTAPERM